MYLVIYSQICGHRDFYTCTRCDRHGIRHVVQIHSSQQPTQELIESVMLRYGVTDWDWLDSRQTELVRHVIEGPARYAGGRTMFKLGLVGGEVD